MAVFCEPELGSASNRVFPGEAVLALSCWPKLCPLPVGFFLGSGLGLLLWARARIGFFLGSGLSFLLWARAVFRFQSGFSWEAVLADMNKTHKKHVIFMYFLMLFQGSGPFELS